MDGQRLDEPGTSGGGVVVAKYPLGHGERIEFIRGSGSAIYGSNAMMGVVDIVTRSNVTEASVYGYSRRDFLSGVNTTIGARDAASNAMADSTIAEAPRAAGESHWFAQAWLPRVSHTERVALSLPHESC